MGMRCMPKTQARGLRANISGKSQMHIHLTMTKIEFHDGMPHLRSNNT